MFGRLIFGSVGNLALALYVIPHWGHLFDARDYRYADLDMQWLLAAAAVPVLVLLVILPVFASPRPLLRWIAVGLLLYPGCLAVLTWTSLLSAVL